MDMNNAGGMHQNDAEKSQAGTNLVIVILVLVIVVAGVKLLMSSNEAVAPTGDMAATSTEQVADAEEDEAGTDVQPATEMPKPPMPAAQVTGTVPAGKGQVAFSVLSKEAVAVRAIYVHNPFRVSEGDAAWVQVYDGYRAVPAGQATAIFTVSLAALPYDQVRVRTLNVSTGVPDETTKTMPVTVIAGEKTLVTIEI